MSQSRTLVVIPQPIAELQVGASINWYYRVLECQKRKKKDGGDFLALLLMDKSGRIPAKVWENAEECFQLIIPGSIYRIAGEVNEYNQKKEIRVNRITALSGQETDLDPADFTLQAPFDTGDLLRQTREILQVHLTNPYLQQLVEELFASHGDRLQAHYGAQRIHHAYPGGLLEHTLALLKLALAVADLYSLDKELLLVGALLHDIGKLSEFSVQSVPDTTLEGGLLGHVVIGHSLFLELKGRIPDFPPALALKIQHLIISHHGEKEFGSPEVPKTAEAYALHVIDLLDSRLHIFREVSRRSDAKGLFSEYQNTLGARVLLDKE